MTSDLVNVYTRFSQNINVITTSVMSASLIIMEHFVVLLQINLISLTSLFFFHHVLQ